jgi:MFS family permease
MGALGDRVGYLKVITASTVSVVVGVSLMVVTPSLAVIGVGLLLAAIGFTAYWPVMNSYVLERFPESSKAGDFGALGGVYMGAGSLGPTFVGFVADHADYTVAFSVLIVLALVATWSVWSLSKSERAPG